MKKLAASVLLALVASVAFASAVSLSEFPTFLATYSAGVSSPDYYIVVGANAATSDVVGAIDLASTLASLSYQETTAAGVTAQVTGKTAEISFSSAIDSGFGVGTLTSTQVPQLKRGTISYEYNDQSPYRVEKIILPSDTIQYDETGNGTVYVDLTTKSLKYVCVLNTPVTLSGDYSKPLTIYLMGREYNIVNTTADGKIVVISGSIGVATTDVPVKYENIEVYVTDGASGEWVELQITDGTNTITDILNKGETETYTIGGIDIKIKVLDVWASTITSTVKARLVVGEEVDKTIQAGDTFDGYWVFDAIDTDGTANKLKNITLAYEVNETNRYLKLGDVIEFPNDYVEFGLSGFTVNSFATLTFRPTTVTLYDETGQTSEGSYPAIEIEADSPVFASQSYSKIYFVYNYSSNETGIAYYDDSLGKVVEPQGGMTWNKTSDTLAISGVFDTHSFWIVYNGTSNETVNGTIYIDTFDDGTVGDNGYEAIQNADITLTVRYDGLVTEKHDFFFGTEKSEADNNDINIADSNAASWDSSWDYDIILKKGTTIVTPQTKLDGDTLVIKLPAEQQKVLAYVGKAGGTTTTGGAVREVVTITSPVAKLDTEVTSSDKTSKNLVIVGGPCANSLAQELVDAGKLDADYTCSGGLGAAWTANTAYIIAIDDAFITGKVALFVAGTNADDTRAAVSVLQNYATRLSGVTSNAIKLDTSVATPAITEL